MTTSLSPVTEADVNHFFNGLDEFKSRLATGIVAYSEQAREIARLTELVNRLQASVDALTNTIRQLTDDRDQARAEAFKAKEGERVAIEMAEQSERKYNEVVRLYTEAQDTIATLTNIRTDNEIVVSDLRAMNSRQEDTLRQAIDENQRLQDKISQLFEEGNNAHSRVKEFQHQNAELERRLKRLTGTLSAAKTVLEDIPSEPTYPHAVNS